MMNRNSVLEHEPYLSDQMKIILRTSSNPNSIKDECFIIVNMALVQASFPVHSLSQIYDELA